MSKTQLTPVSPSAQRTHIGFETHSIQKTKDFYQVLLDQAPAKEFADYLKFDSHVPSLNISFRASKEVSASAGLGHFGLEMQSGAQVDAVMQRLEEAGYELRVEDGTCCYANAHKAWVRDPDGRPWEIYTILKDTTAFSSDVQVEVPAGECCARSE